MKKGRIIEDALRRISTRSTRCQAEYIIPTRIVVTAETWDWIVDEIGTRESPHLRSAS